MRKKTDDELKAQYYANLKKQKQVAHSQRKRRTAHGKQTLERYSQRVDRAGAQLSKRGYTRVMRSGRMVVE